jgi:rod shape-determining protein MreC
MPAGQVKIVRPGSPFQEIFLDPSGLQNGLEEILIVLEGVHQTIPDAPNASAAVHLQSAPPADASISPTPSTAAASGTDADKLRDRYKAIGEAQNHKFGEGLPGSKPPDFNAPITAKPKPPPAVPPTPPADPQ